MAHFGLTQTRLFYALFLRLCLFNAGEMELAVNFSVIHAVFSNIYCPFFLLFNWLVVAERWRKKNQSVELIRKLELNIYFNNRRKQQQSGATNAFDLVLLMLRVISSVGDIFAAIICVFLPSEWDT